MITGVGAGSFHDDHILMRFLLREGEEARSAWGAGGRLTC
jgi:hypothetical protein